jgi:hypothetical protein
MRICDRPGAAELVREQDWALGMDCLREEQIVNGSQPRRLGTRFVARLATALAAVLAFSVVAYAAAAASASGTLPLSPVYLNATAAYNGLQVRPAIISYTGDGTGFLGGPRARDQRSHLRWSAWTRQLARGTGFDQINDCNPFCARGHFHGFPIRIELWRPRTLAGTLVFTRMTIWYTASRPPSAPRHYTYTDTLTAPGPRGYSWWPPSENGYCVNTQGLKPEPECKNIHALPPS